MIHYLVQWECHYFQVLGSSTVIKEKSDSSTLKSLNSEALNEYVLTDLLNIHLYFFQDTLTNLFYYIFFSMHNKWYVIRNYVCINKKAVLMYTIQSNAKE